MRPLTKISLFGVRLATCVLAIYWTALFTGTHLPAIPAIVPRVSDKAMHFSGFFILTILLCWVVPTRRKAIRKFAIVACVALAYGIFDEFSQGFVRGRTPDVRDFAADSTGVFVAISLYALTRSMLPKWSDQTPLKESKRESSTTRAHSTIAEAASIVEAA